MSYAYDQRKRPRGPQDPASARTGAPERGSNIIRSGLSAPQSSPSFNLDAAMQARMDRTLGTCRR